MVGILCDNDGNRIIINYEIYLLSSNLRRRCLLLLLPLLRYIMRKITNRKVTMKDKCETCRILGARRCEIFLVESRRETFPMLTKVGNAKFVLITICLNSNFNNFSMFYFPIIKLMHMLRVYYHGG